MSNDQAKYQRIANGFQLGQVQKFVEIDSIVYTYQETVKINDVTKHLDTLISLEKKNHYWFQKHLLDKSIPIKEILTEDQKRTSIVEVINHRVEFDIVFVRIAYKFYICLSSDANSTNHFWSTKTEKNAIEQIKKIVGMKRASPVFYLIGNTKYYRLHRLDKYWYLFEL